MANQSVNIREAFQARPGYYFMDPDYSQIEFRLSAAMAGERDILLGFKQDKDYYKTVFATMAKAQGRTITSDDVTKPERQVGKVLALGQQYDQGPGGLARKVGCSVQQAKELMDQYWAGLAATARAKEIAVGRALRDGYITTWFGFKRFLPELRSQNRILRGKAMRSVWSTIIQGTAANWMKIAMLRCARVLRQQDRDAHLLLTVHDELLFEVSEREPLHEIMDIVKQGMEFKVPNLPVDHHDLYPGGFYCPAEFEFGYDWGNLYNLDDPKPALFDAEGKRVIKDDKGGKIIGFRTFCALNGRSVNFDAPRPEMLSVSFVAQHNTAPRVTVEPRKKLDTKDDNFVGCGSLDPLDAVIAWAEGNPPQDPQMALPMMHIPAAPEVESETIVLAKDVAKAEPIVEVPVERTVPSTPPPTFAAPVGTTPAATVTPIRPPPEPVTAPVVAKPPNGSNGQVIVPPNDDYAYPCLVIRAGEELNKKQLGFFKILLQKFPGDCWVYLEYKGKTIRAGDKLKVNPSPELFTYIKKGLGEQTSHEIYDERGSAVRGRIKFV